MSELENKSKINEDVKLEKFSKISYLKKRWDIPSLTRNDLDKYNKWSNTERYKTIMIELELEHYLTTNLLIDLGKRSLTDVDNFSNIATNDAMFIKLLKKIENINKGSETVSSDLMHLSFGEKIWFWSSLKKGIFKNKFFRWDLDANGKKQLVIALNNIRKVRNGIAHMNSKEQIEAKMVVTDSFENIKEPMKLLKKAKSKYNRNETEKNLKVYESLRSNTRQLFYRNSFAAWTNRKKRY